MKKAIYAGSFDIFTNGHRAILCRALRIFDHVTLLVGISPTKKTLFTLEERMTILKELFKGDDRITVDKWEGLTTEYAKANGISFLIRGLRPTGDFDSEYMMARINHKLNHDLETVFLITDSKTDYISSSMVREVWSYGGPIEDFVPPVVFKYLSELPMNRR